MYSIIGGNMICCSYICRKADMEHVKQMEFKQQLKGARR